MELEQFKTMVARLEAESMAAPAAYKAKVAGLAVLGFGILALMLGALGFGLELLAGFAVVVVLTGGKALYLLFTLGKLLFLLAVPMWFLVQHAVKALFVRLPAPQGVPVVRAQAPALFDAIDGMRRRFKGPRVHQVLVVDEVNAAVVQRPVFGLVGWPRNYLLLGLPLLESMAPDEALAVVAHEYGHLAGSHGRFGAWIYRLRHTWGTVQAFAEQLQGWLGWLLRPLVRWYAPYFNAYTFVLARANEYEADAASVELVGADAAARALKRVNLVEPHYQTFVGKTLERMRDEARPPPDLAQRWADHALLPAPAEDAQKWLAEALDREGQVADTHPVLRKRLAAMPGQQGAELEALPPPRVGPSAAEAWLGEHLAVLRRGLQTAWAERLAASWSERHESIQQDRRRLAELRAAAAAAEAAATTGAAATLELDDRFEMLRLQTSLEIEVDQRDAWAAFNAEQPDHAGGLFFEGAERLYHDDAAGLALLERAVALDAELTKPACERAHAYLSKHKDAAAEAYAERWRARDELESRRLAELRTIDLKHPLAAPAPELVEAVRTLLTPAALVDVDAVYLARRELPSDPSMKTYVLAVTLDLCDRTQAKQQAVVDRLAAITWPVHLIVCTLEGDYAQLREPLQALPGARLRWLPGAR
ncbi:MAG: hypothetical protein RIQ60_1143 [Pseudomonadota bacterium]|jgi:Zn-dependent protease with chaperone function